MPAPDDPENRPSYLEIDSTRKARWLGLLSYLAFFALVAGLLVVLFVRFTGSYLVAAGLVIFMIGYMAVMGYWASRNLEDRR